MYDMVKKYDQFIIDMVDHIESLGIEFSTNPSTYTHKKSGRWIRRTPHMEGLIWYTMLYEFCGMIESENKKVDA